MNVHLSGFSDVNKGINQAFAVTTILVCVLLMLTACGCNRSCPNAIKTRNGTTTPNPGTFLGQEFVGKWKNSDTYVLIRSYGKGVFTKQVETLTFGVEPAHRGVYRDDKLVFEDQFGTNTYSYLSISDRLQVSRTMKSTTSLPINDIVFERVKE